MSADAARSLGLVLAVIVAGLIACPALAEETLDAPGTFYRVGRLHVGDGKVLKDAVIGVENGRFTVVRVAGEAPPFPVTHLPDAVAAPGFIDAVTSLGLAGGAVEGVRALTPGVRAVDAFDPDSKSLRGVARSGITTLGLLPAAGNVAAGRAGAAGLGSDRPRVVRRVGAPVFSFMPPALRRSRVPATLAGARLLLDAAFAGRRWETAAEAPLPTRDSALRRLKALTSGRCLAWVDTPSAADVAASVLRGQGLSPTLIGLRRAADDPDRVAQLGLPCVVTGLGPEDSVRLLSLPGRLARAGVDVVVSTGAPARSATSLRTGLALAVAHGLPPEQAVPSVTGRAAAVLGLADRVGRVATGFEADLVVFSGEPWELRSRLLLVLSDGEVVVDRTRDATTGEDAR